MRFRYLVGILVLVLLAESLLVVPEVWNPGRQFMAAVWPAVVVDLANADRVNVKRQPLQINPLLTKAAQLKAEDMARRSYFAHEGPKGETPWSWLDQVGYEYVYAGENLALDFYDSNEVNQAWLNSPKHRDNILDKNFTEIGVGLATGRYQGHDSVFIVQFFGSTEKSLAERIKSPTSASFKRTNFLSAAIGLADGAPTKLRALSLPIIHWLGYSEIKGKII